MYNKFMANNFIIYVLHFFSKYMFFAFIKSFSLIIYVNILSEIVVTRMYSLVMHLVPLYKLIPSRHCLYILQKSAYDSRHFYISVTPSYLKFNAQLPEY